MHAPSALFNREKAAYTLGIELHRWRPNIGLELTASSVRSSLAPASSSSSGPAFGSEIQQHLSITASGLNSTGYGLYWSQNRQNFVKICRLQ
jgi:hypothetical protein